jgi:hypothetical protein
MPQKPDGLQVILDLRINGTNETMAKQCEKLADECFLRTRKLGKKPAIDYKKCKLYESLDYTMKKWQYKVI